MLTFNEFVAKTESEIIKYLKETNVTIDIRDVRKNNGLMLTGLTIKRANSNIAPTIYLESFYDEYCHSLDFDGTIISIARAYENSLNQEIPNLNLDDLTEESIIGVLINTWNNQELLEDVPSISIYDNRFKVVFRYTVDIGGSSGSILITDDIAAAKGYSDEALCTIALKNAEKNVTLQSMESVLNLLMGGDDSITGINTGMFVLGNTDNHYGAFSILTETAQEKLMEQFTGNLVVLPSSIHELIILPFEMVSTSFFQELNSIIHQVNESEVAPDEILDDEFFILQRTAHGYEFADCLKFDTNSSSSFSQAYAAC